MSVFNFVLNEVEDVVSRLVNEVSRIETERDALGNVVEQVVGVDWTGEGAQAFYNEVATRLVPEIAALLASIAGFQLNISKAQDRVIQGDQDANKSFQSLCDQYEQINI